MRSKWVELIDGVSPVKTAKDYASRIGIMLSDAQLNTIMDNYASSSLLIEQCVNVIIAEIYQSKLSQSA